MNMEDMLLLWPAYGRKYESPVAAVADWLAGKDFGLNRGGAPYCSIRDNAVLKVDGVTHVGLVWTDTLGLQHWAEVEL